IRAPPHVFRDLVVADDKLVVRAAPRALSASYCKRPALEELALAAAYGMFIEHGDREIAMDNGGVGENHLADIRWGLRNNHGRLLWEGVARGWYFKAPVDDPGFASGYGLHSTRC